MSMRDRNKIALQSDLLAANDFDIRAILALTGDPASMSDQPHTKGVFESNSLLLLDIIKSFNNNMDYRGKPFTIAPKTFYPFAVIPSFAKSFKTIEKRIIKKINGGAIGIISQPIYDIDNAKKLLESFNKINKNSTLIFGFFPITKLRTARFLSSQVPGIYVPDSWIEMLSKAHNISELEEEKVGFKLSQQLFLELKNLLEVKKDVIITFNPRPGISYSLRAKHLNQKTKDLFVMIDVIDDNPSDRWLSICFYGDMITDPEEKGNLIPGGLKGEDGYCFDMEEANEKYKTYIIARIEEAYQSALKE
jgi:5,10-methylenetetrahydrofolate reductase